MTTATLTDIETILLTKDARLEVFDGDIREKPLMTWSHYGAASLLDHQLRNQLSPDDFFVQTNSGYLRRTEKNYLIPDLLVIPRAVVDRHADRWHRLEVIDEPLPLVVEIWSPLTGRYDVNTKIPVYQRRGDLEIWRIHVVERSLTTWRREEDGEYAETTLFGGAIEPIALPGVTIDVDALFL